MIRPRQTLGRVVATGMLGALLVLSAPGRVAVLEASSAPPTPAPGLIVPPVASGVVRIGELLTCTDGVWSDATSYTYQWTRDGAPIGGATAATHTVVGADIACELRCEVTATGPGGVSAPEASAPLASPWQPILVARPGVLIWDGLDPQCYGGAAVSAPVAALYTVDGVLLGTQAVTAAQGTRLSGALYLDGTDDRYACDAHAGVVDLAHTLIAGWSAPATTGTRHVLTAALATSTSSGRQIRISYVSTGTAGARRVYYNDGGAAINLDLVALGGGPEDLLVRSAVPGGTARAHKLDSALTALASGTRPGGANSHSLLTIGALRYAAGPTTNGFWRGELRHLALDDSAWSDTDALLYRTCAIAAGVM